MTHDYTAIMPIKSWFAAKSRLALPSDLRGDLARAFAEDVLSAAAAASSIGRIVVVSSADGIPEVAARWGAHLVAEPDAPSADRLNSAISAGVTWAAEHRPLDPVVVVPADLPSLTGDALSALLTETAGIDRVVIPDAGGDGTALLIAADPSRLSPSYGVGSAARHVGLGYVPMLEVDPRLRRDVDSLADLSEALGLGVGEATTAVLRRHPLDLVS